MNRMIRRFTLVELLVAIAVITILASVAVVSARFVLRKQTDTKMRAAVTILRGAISDFYENNKRWPNIFKPYRDYQSENATSSSPLLSNTPARAVVFIFGEAYEPDDPKRTLKRGLWEMPVGRGSEQVQKLVISESDWGRIRGAFKVKTERDASRIADVGSAVALKDLWDNVVPARLSKKVQKSLKPYGVTESDMEYKNVKGATFDIFSFGEDGVEYDPNSTTSNDDDIYPEN